MWITSNIFNAIATLAGISALIFVTIWYAAISGTWPNRIVSWVINLYLHWRHPIKSENGTRTFPTCPYQFPDGQGNISKFLDGASLSKVWREQYGSVYRLWSGFTPEVVLTRPDQIQTVFRNSNLHLKSQDMNSGWLCGELLGECLGLRNQRDWTRIRAAVDGPFHQNVSASYIAPIQQRVQTLFQTLQQTSPLGPNQIQIQTTDHLKFLPLFILGDILYGGLSNAMENQLREIVPLREQLWQEVIKGGISRYSIGQILPTSTNYTLKRFKDKWTKFNDDACESLKNRGLKTPIVEMYAALDDGRLSKNELLQTLDEILFANLDVTIGNFSWNPVFLAAHPDIQEDLRHEIAQASNDNSPGVWEKYITSNSTLLMACVLESARLKPMAPFSISQAAPTDCEIDNFVIPAGTNYIVDTHAINIFNTSWGKDNTLYRPKRFLENKGNTQLRYTFWRYGFGPRQCLGKHVADVILKSLLAYMLKNYRLKLNQTESVNPDDWENKSGVWISLAIQDIICEAI